MILEESIQEVLSVARIEDVVSDYVALKKSGSSYKGLSPFSKENTPSFYVLPVKQIFKDFSSGKGGDVVTFLKEIENLSFPDAIRFLAKRYNIQLRESVQALSKQETEQRNHKESLLIVCDYAQNFFEDQLWKTNLGQELGLAYFQNRGFSPEIIRKFHLGFSPPERNIFTKTALEQGHTIHFLLENGLVKQKDQSFYDFFRDRVIFPIHNIAGRVIAFGARTLKTEKTIPKYINSPETEIYHKSDILYGIFQARQSIIREKKCYLVEGYTDVIAMHQAGIENTLASAGTALTVEQIRLIKRYTSHLVLLYDGDPAGIQASFRGIDLLLKEGMNVQIVLLPDNHDPDSFARTHDEAELQTFLQENAQDFVFFKAQIFLKETKNNPAEKSQKIKDIIQSIAYIPDSITRELYLKECSSIFDMDLSILWAELNNSLILHQKQTDREHANRGHANRGHANHLEIESKYSEKQILSVENSENINANELAKPENLTEAELIKALLLYGSQWIHLKKEDQTITIPLAWYLVLEIESDELTFEDDVFQRIYLVYKTASENKENVPVENYFIHHTDLEIQQVAVGFFSFPHIVSENWKKFQVYPTAIEKNLEEYSTWLVTRFKYEKVQNLLKKTMEELKKTLEEEEIDKLMKKLTLLNNLKKHFAALLGIVAHHISFRN